MTYIVAHRYASAWKKAYDLGILANAWAFIQAPSDKLYHLENGDLVIGVNGYVVTDDE